MSKNLFELISIERRLVSFLMLCERRAYSRIANINIHEKNRNLNLEHLVERLTLNRLNQNTAKITIR